MRIMRLYNYIQVRQHRVHNINRTKSNIFNMKKKKKKKKEKKKNTLTQTKQIRYKCCMCKMFLPYGHCWLFKMSCNIKYCSPLSHSSNVVTLYKKWACSCRIIRRICKEFRMRLGNPAHLNTLLILQNGNQSTKSYKKRICAEYRTEMFNLSSLLLYK